MTKIFSQSQGLWTWKGGGSLVNGNGSFFAKGQEHKNNYPPSLYEAIEWQDLDGNFWFFGGTGHFNYYTDDLWKFNINSELWTWYGGSKCLFSQRPAYGTIGIPSTSNTPGLRTTSFSWVDLLGNFWLYGGLGCDTSNNSSGIDYSDLWKFNPKNLTWVFMKGSKYGGSVGNYGIMGVENTLNQPPPISENNVCWTSNDGDLWLLDNLGCLWQYKISTNNWIWVNGNPMAINPPTYGIKGVPNVNNNPGSFYLQFTRWKDSKGNFWFYEGNRGVLWKYQLNINSWTWVWGDTIQNTIYNYGNKLCDELNKKVNPAFRAENRACWVDDCDNLWMLSGWDGYDETSDLVYYEIKNDKWKVAWGDTTNTPFPTYGVKNIPSPINKPSSREGTLPFKDVNGNLWLFGGIGFGLSYFGDLWMYTPDSNCTKCKPKNPNYLSLKNLYSFESNSIIIFPNPTSNNFFIREIKIFEKMTILNFMGQIEDEILINNENEIQIELNSGIHFLKFIGNNNSVTKKVIVNSE